MRHAALKQTLNQLLTRKLDVSHHLKKEMHKDNQNIKKNKNNGGVYFENRKEINKKQRLKKTIKTI